MLPLADTYTQGYRAGQADTQRDAVKACALIVLAAGGEVHVPATYIHDDVELTIQHNDFTNEIIYRAQRR